MVAYIISVLVGFVYVALFGIGCMVRICKLQRNFFYISFVAFSES